MNSTARIAILGLLTLGCWLWLWFMVKRPDRWGMLVERENSFWVRIGIVSASLSEKIKGLEKGRGMQVLVGATAVFGSAGILFLFYIRR